MTARETVGPVEEIPRTQQQEKQKYLLSLNRNTNIFRKKVGELLFGTRWYGKTISNIKYIIYKIYIVI